MHLEKHHLKPEFDLEQDLKQEILKAANNLGIKISSKKSAEEALMGYLTVWMKLITPKPRTVLINPAFQNEIPKHPKRKEIRVLMNVAANGINLNYFQSKRIVQSNFHDHLQAEWNIYHFHLSLEKEVKTNFKKQVDWLLFAYIDDEQFIALGTSKHNTGVFGDTKWVDILHTHFPNIIAEYKRPDIKKVYPEVTAIQRQRIWDNGFSLAMTKIKDSVYVSPGLGRVTSGHSIKISLASLEIMRWIYKLKLQIEDSCLELCQLLGIPLGEVKFKIRIGQESFELYEANSNKRLVVFPEIMKSKEDLIVMKQQLDDKK